jgi:hypothetical protein
MNNSEIVEDKSVVLRFMPMAEVNEVFANYRKHNPCNQGALSVDWSDDLLAKLMLPQFNHKDFDSSIQWSGHIVFYIRGRECKEYFKISYTHSNVLRYKWSVDICSCHPPNYCAFDVANAIHEKLNSD